MLDEVHGELIPEGGGDPIPLIRPTLVIGHRESCDICARYLNVSGRHAELRYRNGCWYIQDLNSTNGVKVNGIRVQEALLRPNDTVTIGKRTYTIRYTMKPED